MNHLFKLASMGLLTILLSGCLSNTITIRIVDGQRGTDTTVVDSNNDSVASTLVENEIHFTEEGLEDLPFAPKFSQTDLKSRVVVEKKLVKHIHDLRDYIKEYKKRVNNCREKLHNK